MSHAFDMINRIRMNQEIKGKRNTFPTSTSSNKGSKVGYNFKVPTEEELKQLEIKNQQFLKQQKRNNLIAFTVSFAIAMIIMSWVYFYWPWGDMIVGFMKGHI